MLTLEKIPLTHLSMINLVIYSCAIEVFYDFKVLSLVIYNVYNRLDFTGEG